MVSRTADALVRDLQSLPFVARVESFADLFAEAPVLHAFAPKLILAEPGADLARELGALQLLLRMLPDARLLLVADQDTREQLAEAPDPDLNLLPADYSPVDLQTQVRKLIETSPSESGETYLGFAQGICDEINNPLMFASGHLQLLHGQLDPEQDAKALSQVRAVQDGLRRINETMLKVTHMARASRLDRKIESFSLEMLVRSCRELCTDHDLEVKFEGLEELPPMQLSGDRELLARGLLHLCQVGQELSGTPEQSIVLRLEMARDILQIRMRVEHARLHDWELPKAFEPYHLNAIMGGTTLGLNLFLVRLVARAHSGDAIARRIADQAVEFLVGLGV